MGFSLENHDDGLGFLSHSVNHARLDGSPARVSSQKIVLITSFSSNDRKIASLRDILCQRWTRGVAGIVLRADFFIGDGFFEWDHGDSLLLAVKWKRVSRSDLR